MKKAILVLSLFSLFGCNTNVNVKSESKLKFRNVSWNVSPSGFRFLRKEGLCDLYVNDTDKLCIGKIEVDSIIYSFYKRRLCSINITYATKLCNKIDSGDKSLRSAWWQLEGKMKDYLEFKYGKDNENDYLLHSIPEGYIRRDDSITLSMDCFKHKVEFFNRGVVLNLFSEEVKKQQYEDSIKIQSELNSCGL